jgi:hypothetical protein
LDALNFEEALGQDLHLGEDLLIQLTNASKAALEGWEHFFLQEGGMSSSP